MTVQIDLSIDPAIKIVSFLPQLRPLSFVCKGWNEIITKVSTLMLSQIREKSPWWSWERKWIDSIKDNPQKEIDKLFRDQQKSFSHYLLDESTDNIAFNFLNYFKNKELIISSAIIEACSKKKTEKTFNTWNKIVKINSKKIQSINYLESLEINNFIIDFKKNWIIELNRHFRLLDQPYIEEQIKLKTENQILPILEATEKFLANAKKDIWLTQASDQMKSNDKKENVKSLMGVIKNYIQATANECKQECKFSTAELNQFLQIMWKFVLLNPNLSKINKELLIDEYGKEGDKLTLDDLVRLPLIKAMKSDLLQTINILKEKFKKEYNLEEIKEFHLIFSKFKNQQLIGTISIKEKKFLIYTNKKGKQKSFVLDSKLGEGAGGVVYRVSDLSNGKIKVWKELNDLKGMQPKDLEIPIGQLNNEYEKLQKIHKICAFLPVVGIQNKHNQIRRIISIDEGNIEVSENYGYMTKYYNNGDYTNYISQFSESEYSLQDHLSDFYQISKGLEFLHDHGFIHGDIKRTNVFVHIDEEKNRFVHISDFGGVKDGSDIKKMNMTIKQSLKEIYGRGCTTSYTLYKDLDRLEKSVNEENPKEYFQLEKKRDILAQGIIFYCILTRKMQPLDSFGYLDLSEDKLKEMSANLGKARTKNGIKIPKEIQKLILDALKEDPSERPTATKMREMIEKCYQQLFSKNISDDVSILG